MTRLAEPHVRVVAKDVGERWFAELTAKKLKRGADRSVHQLNAATARGSDSWNQHPKPFVWSKTADQTLDSIARYCERSEDCATRSASEASYEQGVCEAGRIVGLVADSKPQAAILVGAERRDRRYTGCRDGREASRPAGCGCVGLAHGPGS